MDNSLSSYFAMKGLIDLRVANILAKQSLLHQQAAVQQAAIAKSEALKAGKLTMLAEGLEKKQTPSSYRDYELAAQMPLPASVERYSPDAYDAPLLPVVAARSMGECMVMFPFGSGPRSLIDFI